MQQPVSATDPPFIQIGQQFAKFYYESMANNRMQLKPLYSEKSCMSFEGSQVQGVNAIMEKIMALTFKTVQHAITTCDCQPVFDIGGADGVFVTVMGQLMTDADPPQSFVQTFVLRTSGENFYIANETFRLVVHNV